MKAFSSYKYVLYHLNLKISNSHPRLGLNATKPLTVKKYAFRCNRHLRFFLHHIKEKFITGVFLR